MRCTSLRCTSWFLLALALVFNVANASSGDRAEIFQDCLSICQLQNCKSPSLHTLPFALQVTGWTCTDNCKYDCMHLITDQAVQQGTEIHQYHGKWPFWRFAGMQEPASVAFSLLNLLAHVRGLREVRRRVRDAHPMKRYYIWFALISINAWLWSSVFHTRDLPITEKLDYFSAALAILYALHYTVVRLFHLYFPTERKHIQLFPGKGLIFWTILCIVAYLGHISYLTFLPRFDYTYNMAFNLVIGLTHNLLWLAYAFPSSVHFLRRYPNKPIAYRPKIANKAAVFVVLTTAATALELLDFPPWGRIIDAHSLWHLATAPIAAFWYEFLMEDAIDDGWVYKGTGSNGVSPKR